MKKIFIKLLLCLVLVTGVFTSAQANIQLSDRSYIALLSCEPGKDVYAKFGHTGIRIVDTLQMMDITYHYGIFSFDTPFFIAKFVKGATDYEIGLTTTEFFMQEYIRRNSTVHQQVLNLNLEQRQELFDALVENYKPENRKYRYNFIFDNCATRPYHIISKSLNSEIVFSNPLPTTTYRSIIDHYVGYDNWLRFGIDLVIGHDADTPIEELATISFPLFLMDYLDKGNLQLSDEMVPLVIQEDVIFEAKPEVPVITHFYDNPINITIIMLCVIALLTIWESYRRRYWVCIDIILFAIYGFIGIVIFFLMFISEHPLVQSNYNLLWLNPLALIFAILVCFNKFRRPLRYYMYLNLLLVVTAMIIFVCKIQLMHAAFFPLMLCSLIRSVHYISNKTPITKRKRR